MSRTLNLAMLTTVVGLLAGGCGNMRGLPIVYMPDPPKECEKVLGFSVDPLPKGKSTATRLSVDMAKEGATRQDEHAIARVCAEYALRTAGVMKEGTPPTTAKGAQVAAATIVPPTPGVNGASAAKSGKGRAPSSGAATDASITNTGD